MEEPQVSLRHLRVNTQQMCRLLHKLPSELRNAIYKLSFTKDGPHYRRPESKPARFSRSWQALREGMSGGLVGSSTSSPQPTLEEGEIDFLDAAPPSDSLLFTCKILYQEACGYYKEASREYWSSTKFAIVSNTKTEQGVCAKIESLPLEAIRCMEAVRIVGTSWWSWPYDRRGAWWVGDDHCDTARVVVTPGHETSRPGMLPRYWEIESESGKDVRHLINTGMRSQAIQDDTLRDEAETNDIRQAIEEAGRVALTKYELTTIVRWFAGALRMRRGWER
ncbi:Uu.00g003860.m01.CDS01 [Anthostomella pinea]|uniref:Uu.00g003860.m01.CDS01 n=1 Tax=Anthostomella pinea TaxID=933095 RepID=A0AAI8YIM8_9PEZI|nr:Uu.00g003860.m01.CDS01 [Anthostomella pinea]